MGWGFGFSVVWLGFRVSGSVSFGEGFRFRVQGCLVRVPGFGFRVFGLGFQVSGSGFSGQGVGVWIQGCWLRVLGSGFREWGLGCIVQCVVFTVRVEV